MHPKTLLDQYHLEPRKSLGQNFLHDPQILQRLVGAADVDPGDNVLEIGPGTGALTRFLAPNVGQVVAIEIDDHLMPLLELELAGFDNVTVVQGDVLEHDPGQWFSGSAYLVVANLPYYITGAILRHLLGAAHPPRRLVITVQLEVAERLLATPPSMSLLSVSVQFYSQVTLVTRIKAGAFWPRPNVDSAVLRLDVYPDPGLDIASQKPFFDLVRVGFSQKRKQIQKNLRQLGHDRRSVDGCLVSAGIDPQRRAQTLTIKEWIALYYALSNLPTQDDKGD